MSRRIVDLSEPLSDGRQGVGVRLRADPPRYLGHECYAWDLEIPSHTGTYFETSGHVFRDGGFTDAFPLERLVSRGVCLRVITQERAITARDLDAALPRSSRPALRDCTLLVHTTRRQAGSHAYFSRDSATWMRDQGIALMGSDTPLYDTGFESPTGFFVELFRAGIPIIANIRNLEALPVDGFTVAVLPLAVIGVATVPCRVIALLDEA